MIDWHEINRSTESAYYREWRALQLYHRGLFRGWVWHLRPPLEDRAGYQDVTLCGIALDMSEGGKTFSREIPKAGPREWLRTCRKCRRAAEASDES